MSDRDYLKRTIATVRNHRDADNCWPQWANIFADEIERLWEELDRIPRVGAAAPDEACGPRDETESAHAKAAPCPYCDGIGAQHGAHTERVESCQGCDGTGCKKETTPP